MDYRAAFPADVHFAVGGHPLDRQRALGHARSLTSGGRMVLVTDHDEDLAWWQRLAASAARRGVHANAVSMGLAPFLTGELPPDVHADVLGHLAIRRAARRADLVAALTFLTSPRSSFLVGQVIPCDGGLSLRAVAAPGRASPPLDVVANGVSLVIGASSGIGMAGALVLAQHDDIVLASRRPAELELVAEKIRAGGRKAWVLPCDAADETAVRELVERAWAATGRIDRLLYAAGTLDPATSYAVNLFGYREACGQLVARWTDEGMPGSIAGVSSISAIDATVPRTEDYGASKAAMAQYSRGLAATAGRRGVRVNCVCPGLIRTPMVADADPRFLAEWARHCPAGRPGEPEEVADVIAYLLGASYVTGAVLRVDGGLGLGVVPSLATTLL